MISGARVQIPPSPPKNAAVNPAAFSFHPQIRRVTEVGTFASAACGGYSEQSGVAAVEILRAICERKISGTATGHNGAVLQFHIVSDLPRGSSYTEGYRSGHNGAVLKTVRAKVHAGSNPAPSAKAKILSRKWQDFCFVFFIFQFSVFILHFCERIFEMNTKDLRLKNDPTRRACPL